MGTPETLARDSSTTWTRFHLPLHARQHNSRYALVLFPLCQHRCQHRFRLHCTTGVATPLLF
ncbi:MAG: hypothetical protein OXC07_04510 [Kistimonas sp.]|nr:hypothetical protein [Kistimonas sp.]